ncbi:MAG: hypothetical protein L0Z50_07505 [Verrucomicrobiales bacterium]|nr:hypothetical protein [Verrucomicrobiales bacterium]
MIDNAQPTVRYIAMVCQPSYDVRVTLENLNCAITLASREILNHRRACGFLPVYASLAELRQDFPSAPVVEMLVHQGQVERPAPSKIAIIKNAENLPPAHAEKKSLN